MGGATIAGHAVLRSPGLKAVVAAIEQAGDRVRLVGGAVRNALLALPVKDVDLATTALPDQVIERALAAGLKVAKTGYEHGTVTVIAKGHGYEVTTLRQDIKTDGRRAEVVFGRDWTLDAERRDFTMNALYAGIDGEVFDPLDGLADCLARRVRFIGNAEQRIREDYLRILRFFRFSAVYGNVLDEDGLTACTALKSGLQGLARERIGQEMRRLLIGKRAPEILEAMNERGINDGVFGHAVSVAALVAARRLAAGEIDAVAALFVIALQEASDIARLADGLRLSNAERLRLERAYGALPLVAEGSLQKLHEAIYRHGRQGTEDALLRVARADGVSALAAARAWEAPKFPVRAADLIARGFVPGPELGKRLKALEEGWIAADFAEGFLQIAMR